MFQKKEKSKSLNKPWAIFRRLCYVLVALVCASWVNPPFTRSSKYLLKIQYKDYYNFVLCSEEIFSPKKPKRKKKDETLTDFLSRNYKSIFLINQPYDVDLYGCCEFGNAEKAADLVRTRTIDTVLLKKYNQVRMANNIDTLLKAVKPFKIHVDNCSYDAYLLKVECSYCTCPSFASGSNIPPHTKDFAMLTEVFKREAVSDEKIHQFIKTFEEAKK